METLEEESNKLGVDLLKIEDDGKVNPINKSQLRCQAFLIKDGDGYKIFQLTPLNLCTPKINTLKEKFNIT